jgi:hypothetical protein
MFVRFRETGRRLQCSLIETRRVAGKVRHEHIASLGSVPVPPSVADRVAFWAALHQRLARLSNRVAGDAYGKVLGQVHVRVPMVTPDEQRELQLTNAEADERFWSSLSNMNAATAADHKALIATAERAVTQGEAAAADAAAKATAARERGERIRKGENVQGGFGKPMTGEDLETMLLANGFTKRDLRRMEMLGELDKLGDDVFKVFVRSFRASDYVSRGMEKEAKMALELFGGLDDPAAFARKMLKDMLAK